MNIQGTPEAQSAFFTALAGVKFPGIPKTANNPHLRFRYAPLEKVLECVRPALREAGIALAQPLSGEFENGLVVHTILAGHGAVMTSKVELAPLGDRVTKGLRPVQDIGAEITYIRRYALQSMLAVSADGDVDELPHEEPTAGAASTRAKALACPPAPRVQPEKPAPDRVQQARVDAVREAVKAQKSRFPGFRPNEHIASVLGKPELVATEELARFMATISAPDADSILLSLREDL